MPTGTEVAGATPASADSPPPAEEEGGRDTDTAEKLKGKTADTVAKLVKSDPQLFGKGKLTGGTEIILAGIQALSKGNMTEWGFIIGTKKLHDGDLGEFAYNFAWATKDGVAALYAGVDATGKAFDLASQKLINTGLNRSTEALAQSSELGAAVTGERGKGLLTSKEASEFTRASGSSACTKAKIGFIQSIFDGAPSPKLLWDALKNAVLEGIESAGRGLKIDADRINAIPKTKGGQIFLNKVVPAASIVGDGKNTYGAWRKFHASDDKEARAQAVVAGIGGTLSLAGSSIIGMQMAAKSETGQKILSKPIMSPLVNSPIPKQIGRVGVPLVLAGTVISMLGEKLVHENPPWLKNPSSFNPNDPKYGAFL